jgi:hypothetical protein
VLQLTGGLLVRVFATAEQYLARRRSMQCRETRSRKVQKTQFVAVRRPRFCRKISSRSLALSSISWHRVEEGGKGSPFWVLARPEVVRRRGELDGNRRQTAVVLLGFREEKRQGRLRSGLWRRWTQEARGRL